MAKKRSSKQAAIKRLRTADTPKEMQLPAVEKKVVNNKKAMAVYRGK